MEIVSCKDLTFPVLEYSKRWNYLCAGSQIDYQTANRLRLRNLKNDVVTIYDSAGRKLEIKSCIKGKPRWPGILDFVGFNLKYNVTFHFKLITKLNLSQFKLEVLDKVNQQSKMEEDRDEELFANYRMSIEDANRYEEIVLLFS